MEVAKDPKPKVSQAEVSLPAPDADGFPDSEPGNSVPRTHQCLMQGEPSLALSIVEQMWGVGSFEWGVEWPV